MSSTPQPEAFLELYFGQRFHGFVGLFNRQSRQTRFFDAGALPALITAAKLDSKNCDLYVPISTQVEWRKSTTRGTERTIAAIYGFFADIDIGENKKSKKHYPETEGEALRILDKFPLPPTFVINSGNGLHVHWLLDEPLLITSEKTRAEAKALWRHFQQVLAEHFRKQDCEVDSVGDLMRNFRLPGTLNHTSNPPKLVTIIRSNPKGRYSLEDMTGFVARTKAAPPAKPPTLGRPVSHESILEGCSWYRENVVNAAATCSEPDWYAALSVTVHCVDGERIAHEYSARHPGYDTRETQAKLVHARDDAGPRTCKSIEEDLGYQGCKTCPHYGLIKSPISLGRRLSYNPDKQGPIPLGYTRDGNFALLDPVRSLIVQASAGQLLAGQYLVGLAPSDFWARQFPSPKQIFDAFTAGEILMGLCRRAGPFNPQRIRGRGIWFDKARVVINLGNTLPKDLEYQYLCFERIDLESATEFDAGRLRRFLGHFKWRHPADAMMLFGWLAIAAICGVLKWRPHVFVYGPPRCGKTTIHAVATQLLSPLVISTDGQSSEAGIRQMLGPDSLAIVIDEFESDHATGQLRGIIRLARSASSADTSVLRGTPEGKAMQFSLRTSFFFCAVNPAGLSPADESRIVLLELLMHDNNKEIAQAIAEDEKYFRSVGPAWCAYMIKLADHIPEANSTMEAALPGLDKRHKQNMATLMAGAFVALNQRPPTEDQAKEWAKEYLPIIDIHAEALDRDDAAECLEHLFAHLVDGYPLGHWLALIDRSGPGDKPDSQMMNARKVAQTFGVTISDTGGENRMVISNGSPQVERAFRDTKWADRGWQRALRKLDGATALQHPIYFPHLGKKWRGTAIPTHYLPEPIETPADETKY